jgi:hypothetical protein
MMKSKYRIRTRCATQMITDEREGSITLLGMRRPSIIGSSDDDEREVASARPMIY